MKIPKNKRIIKILTALLGLAAILVFAKKLPWFVELTLSPERFRDYIIGLDHKGILVFIFFQVLQTLIAPIPGEVIQIAGGYIYGVVLGTLYSTAGLMVGGVIAFFFTRIIGYSFVERIVQRKNAEWLESMVNSKKSSFAMFLVFLIPGMPKDFLIYIAGLTPIKPSKFFTILLAGRFPWLLASVCIGANMHNGNNKAAIALIIIGALCFFLGILFKDKIIDKFTKTKQDGSPLNVKETQQ